MCRLPFLWRAKSSLLVVLKSQGTHSKILLVVFSKCFLVLRSACLEAGLRHTALQAVHVHGLLVRRNLRRAAEVSLRLTVRWMCFCALSGMIGIFLGGGSNTEVRGMRKSCPGMGGKEDGGGSSSGGIGAGSGVVGVLGVESLGESALQSMGVWGSEVVGSRQLPR